MTKGIKVKNDHLYGHVPSYLRLLAGQMIERNQQIQKATEDSPIGKPLEAALKADQTASMLGETLNKCFTLLQDDFTTGRINFVRYKEYLQHFSEFFQISDLKKTDVPDEMKPKVILEEINKYIA